MAGASLDLKDIYLDHSNYSEHSNISMMAAGF